MVAVETPLPTEEEKTKAQPFQSWGDEEKSKTGDPVKNKPVVVDYAKGVDEKKDKNIGNLTQKFERFSDEEQERALQFLTLPDEIQRALIEEQEEALPVEYQTGIDNSLELSKKEFPTATKDTPPVLLSPFETLKKTYMPFPHSLRMNAENIIAHLKTELKDYVRYFGADNDYIYLNEFADIELRLKSMETELSRKHKNNGNIPKIADIIPKNTVRVQREKQVQASAIEQMNLETNLSFTQSFLQKTPQHLTPASL